MLIFVLHVMNGMQSAHVIKLILFISCAQSLIATMCTESHYWIFCLSPPSASLGGSKVQLNKFFAKCKSEAGWDAGGSKSFMSIWTEMQVLQKQSRFIIYLRYLRHTNQLTELNLIGCRKFCKSSKIINLHSLSVSAVISICLQVC